MLFDDALGEHVRHVQDLFVHFIKRGNVHRPICLKPGYNFLRRQVQVVVHHLLHFGARPIFRIASLKKGPHENGQLTLGSFSKPKVDARG